MNYKESLKYLDTFVNFEKKAFSADNFSLGKVRFLLQALKVDYQRLKYIHIAGTKGKGSTAQFCASILAASGYKAGLYTSPHLVDIRERIKILFGKDETMISEKKFAALATVFKPLLEKIRKENFSFFEIYTAIALQYFIDCKVDFAVLESGLGGRLDATNVVTPLVSIITPIDYDHTAILGKSLKKIAREKAGIIKKNVPVVSAHQKTQAAKVIKAKCRMQGSGLSILGKDFFAEKIIAQDDSVTFNYVSKAFNIKKLKSKIIGQRQAENAALAIAALKVIEDKGSVKKLNYRQGLRKAWLPARFQVVCRIPLTILDVAHNEVSFEALKQNLKDYFPGKKVILIFAVSADKDFRAMLRDFCYEQLILCEFDHPRCRPAQEIKRVYPYGRLAENIHEAYSLAEKFCNKERLILIAGSFFLAGEFLKVKDCKTGNR